MRKRETAQIELDLTLAITTVQINYNKNKSRGISHNQILLIILRLELADVNFFKKPLEEQI